MPSRQRIAISASSEQLADPNAEYAALRKRLTHNNATTISPSPTTAPAPYNHQWHARLNDIIGADASTPA